MWVGVQLALWRQVEVFRGAYLKLECFLVSWGQVQVWVYVLCIMPTFKSYNIAELHLSFLIFSSRPIYRMKNLCLYLVWRKKHSTSCLNGNKICTKGKLISSRSCIGETKWPVAILLLQFSTSVPMFLARATYFYRYILPGSCM